MVCACSVIMPHDLRLFGKMPHDLRLFGKMPHDLRLFGNNAS